MNEMENNCLVERIFETSNNHNLALQAIDHRFKPPGISGGMNRSIKTNLVRIISILTLATIMLIPGRGLEVGAARQAVQPAVPTAPALSVTARVSVASDGSQGNDMSGYYEGISLSADGRYVAFHSLASSLVSGDTNEVADIFVHDRGEGNFVFYLPVTQIQP
jgi:hypothetical protein